MKNWDQLTKGQVRKMQNAKLRGFIRNQVYPFSNHYRKIMDDEGINPSSIRTVSDLQKLPFTNKEDLLPTPERPKRPKDFLLMPDREILRRRPSVILNTLLYGKRQIQLNLESEYQPLLMTSTTGRSAAPVPFLYTRQDTDNLRTAGGRVIDLGNGTREDRILNLFPYAPHLAYWVTHYAAHSRNIFSVGTGGGKVLGTTGNLDLMEKIQPSILVGMP
ncbi:MAG: phenylacetate--CoA ligase family protein, partial [Opitutae bacterium]|nr:phenylacetate--CoA ligase family protein [Opitutae bacterium]